MNERKPRLILPCADDDNGFKCYICDKNDFPKIKNLYNHLVKCHHSDWRDILPEELRNYSSIMVRHKLFDTISSDTDDSSNMTINDDECCSIECSAKVNMRKFLPDWSVNGKLRSKRRRSEIKINVKVSPEVVGSPAKKLKVAEAADNMHDDVLPTKKKSKVVEAVESENNEGLVVGLPAKKTTETKADMVAGGGVSVVFDLDLNEPGPEKADMDHMVAGGGVRVVFDLDLNEPWPEC